MNHYFFPFNMKAAGRVGQIQSVKAGKNKQKHSLLHKVTFLLLHFFPSSSKSWSCVPCLPQNIANAYLSSLGDFSCMILETVTVSKFYLFLRFSFLLLVCTAPFTAGACVAFACPVNFRCSNSLFRDGNAQLQVTQ